MIKYILCGGEVKSKHDNDVHYISAIRLAKLYNLNIRGCVFVDQEESPELLFFKENHPNAKILKPRKDGDYTIK